MEAKYQRSQEDDGDESSFLVGSNYGGLVFRFKGGAVESIALGAFAF